MQDPFEVSTNVVQPKRRSYTKEFKAELVAQCDAGERSLAQIALANQINANQLRRWQREKHQSASGAKLVPVKVSKVPTTGTSTIEIAFDTVVVRFNGPVDPISASTIISLLR